MRHGFVRSACGTPEITVADCGANALKIKKLTKQAIDSDVKLLVLPELCLTGYTCGDLFLQSTLLEGAKNALAELVEFSYGKDIVVAVGLPLAVDGRLYNCAAIFQDGVILGVVPKQHIPNYAEFYELRHFSPGTFANATTVNLCGQQVAFGTDLLFCCENMPEFVLATELCEDLWVPYPPSTNHVLSGATVIANLSASNETTGKHEYRLQLVQNQSARLICAYIYASAGEGESTTDLVFSGHNIIAENGVILSQSENFLGSGLIISEIDVQRLSSERRRMTSYFPPISSENKIRKISFTLKHTNITLSRPISCMPFVPSDSRQMEVRCNEILSIQAMGLKKRLAHTKAKTAIVAISGGLDSTLALLVTARAMDMLGKERQDIIAVTMPCFGTTNRTYNNAKELAISIGAELREIPIAESVLLHLKDIGHDKNIHDVTYENAQARERTQVVMDIANKTGGLLIGTGDMSELALGWATYNGDHMSMYAVNAGVPKTLVKYLISYFAKSVDNDNLKTVLADILATPVSPELLPPVDGEIVQITEDIIGPYELHDFFLYYFLRYGFPPEKILFLAKTAFEKSYSEQEILKWLKLFYKRFFASQFKRSCMPDSPKIGSVALSPRGDWRMPSDAVVELWLKRMN